MNNQYIKSFRDLEVYQEAFNLCVIVMKEVVPKLPQSEKFDLTDQLSRSCKAVPRLIAEGYAKRHQKAGFQKYLDDAMGESNETAASLEQVAAIYDRFINKDLCHKLIKRYDILGRRIYSLRGAWSNFKTLNHNPSSKLASLP